MLSQFELTYPLRTPEPQDVYSLEWQKELLQELDYNVKIGASRVSQLETGFTLRIIVVVHQTHGSIIKILLY